MEQSSVVDIICIECKRPQLLREYVNRNTGERYHRCKTCRNAPRREAARRRRAQRKAEEDALWAAARGETVSTR